MPLFKITLFRKSAITLLLLLFGIPLFSQTYTGQSRDKRDGYSCSLKIQADSSVLFIYSQGLNETFAEYSGIIKKRNDSLYHVSATMTFGKFDIMRLYVIPDDGKPSPGDYVTIDSTFLRLFGPVSIIYANGLSKKYNEPGPFLLDTKLFNKKAGSDFYTISTSTTNKITGKKLSFYTSVNSSPDFEHGDHLEFYLVLKGNTLSSSGNPPQQTGHFRMTKKP